MSEERQDPVITYYYGPAFRMNRRLKEVSLLVDGYVQKWYVLNYSSYGISKVSFLSSITEYGKGGTALPPTTFSYQSPRSSDIWNTDVEWFGDQSSEFVVSPGAGSSLGFIASGINMALVDMNGDNLPDLLGCRFVTSTTPKSEWFVRLNTGNGFTSQEYIWLDAEHSYTSYLKGMTTLYEALLMTKSATLADMNKDGLPDLVYSKLAGFVSWGMGTEYGIYDIMVRYNTGTKFSDTEVKLFDCNDAYYTFEDKFYAFKIGATISLVDLNGDGLPDLVYHKQRGWVPFGYSLKGSVHDWTVRLNTGSGFSNEEKTWLSYDKAYFIYKLLSSDVFEWINIHANSMLADMNNDGLLDLVYNDFAREVTVDNSSAPSFNWKVRYNTGTQFSDEVVTLYSEAPVYVYGSLPSWTMSSVHIGVNGTLADINNDGLMDIIFNKFEGSATTPKTDWYACFNMGNQCGEPVKIQDSLNYLCGIYTNKVLTFNSYCMDIDGDGVSDFVYPQFTSFANWRVKFKLMVRKSRGDISQTLLTSQVSPFGGKTEMSYASSLNFDNTGADTKNDLPFIMPLVKTTTKNPGVGDVGVTTYVLGWGV